MTVIKSEISDIKPSVYSIKMNKLIQFLKVGYFLHIMTLIGFFLIYLGFLKLVEWLENPESYYYLVLYILIFIEGLTLPFFSEMDALGRYQNYKQIKDKLYSLGYDERLLNPLMHSKCQRDAVIMAAEDLNCKIEVKRYFYKSGYRWYHIFPDSFMNNPLVLFKKVFWTRILFTKHYKLQNFYW